MTPLVLLALQISFTFLALAVLVPRLRVWLASMPREHALEALLWVHVPRSVALGLLAPGQALGLSTGVAMSIAWGDFASALFALLTIVLHRARPSHAGVWVLAFSVLSSIDIVSALALGLGTRVYEHALGVSWFVLTFYVPVVCVAQALLIAILATERTQVSEKRSTPICAARVH